MASLYSLSLKWAAYFANFRRISSSPIDFISYIRRFCVKQTAIRRKKMTEAEKNEAKEALIDYLVMTRRLRYADAENMSYNANFFLKKLLDKVEIKEQEVGRSVTRFLCYNPINEFEPFFESLGLHPLGISRLVPRNLTFLSDDQLLLKNYYTLCDFGIPRNKIGKIYENSRELFYCDPSALASKLQSFSKVGFSWTFLPLLLARTKLILTEKALADLKEALNIMKSYGIEIDWVEENLEECRIFNWSTVVSVLRFFITNGYTKEQLGLLIKEHPDVMFYNCGHTTLSLITFLFKFGSHLSQISSFFLRFPEVHVEVFFHNLWRFFHFFEDLWMDEDAIGHMFRSHTKLLGCCEIKSFGTIKSRLGMNSVQLLKMIEENPEILKTWAIGREIKRSEASERIKLSQFLKEKFLMGIGYAKGSPEMEKMSKRFYGKSSELQKRFDFLVNVGLSHEDVTSMSKLYPTILCRSADALQKKIDVIVEEFGYPVSVLKKFPCCLCCTPERIRLRLSMYNFIRNETGRKDDVPKSFIFAYKEEIFVKRFVRKHPNGMEVWHELKKKIYGSD